MQNTCTKDPLIGLKSFFESEGISEVSQQIVEGYIEDMIIGIVKSSTLAYDIKIMKYFLTNVKTGRPFVFSCCYSTIIEITSNLTLFL